jgi:hypothetical protein
MQALAQSFQNEKAYFATAVNYACKMFMKSLPGLWPLPLAGHLKGGLPGVMDIWNIIIKKQILF